MLLNQSFGCPVQVEILLYCPRVPKLGETWYDIYTTEEIKYALSLNKYILKPIYQAIFNPYIKEFFYLKEKKENEIIKYFSETMLNTLNRYARYSTKG